jgi:alanyl-tRNA synthetase
MKTSEQIREEFLKFWQESPRNFKVVPNMSLVPNVDSTLLFVNSGMFPLAPYLGGQPHPLGKRLCNLQRCLRTNYDDMIEIGDNRHTLMFEMMGDWSLGDFTKEVQIPWILQLHVERYGLDPKRLYVSVFAGDDDAPRDDEAIRIWKEAFAKYGVNAEFSDDIYNVPKDLKEGETWPYRIFPYPKKKNWWERAHAPGELGGPTSEMFYDMGFAQKEQDQYDINDDSGRFIEIGNNVFMEYRLSIEMKWEPLEQKNIDFGGGFERIMMIVQGKNDIFESDIYEPVIKKVEELSGHSYKDSEGNDNELTKYFRILADHSRAATFILGDGVVPSNKDQGYILRRFIRRLVRYGLKLGIEQNFTKDLAAAVIERMQNLYPHLKENERVIIDEIEKEEIKFRRTLEKGLKELERIAGDTVIKEFDVNNPEKSIIDGKTAFYIYETYGFPLEMTLDELEIDDKKSEIITQQFKEEEQAHRDQSRAGAEQKFKGGLADQSRETTKLHTAHHLLLAAMQEIVSSDIKQRGSNITAERLRIDFNLDRKLTDDEIKRVEELVNQKINERLEVRRIEMPKDQAENIGAQMEFGAKYPDIVSIYMIGGDSEMKDFFSAEFCGGPHVSNTSELGEEGKKFQIFAQENVGAGIKRIKAGLV